MTDRTPERVQDEAAPEPHEAAAAELLERLQRATLGEYEILGELGRGGMATVYLAHEISLDRKVAIKVMSPAMLHGAGSVERFKREARTAANLSHPNIIPIIAVRESEGLLFCVIKLVQGTPLDTIMHELEQLPVAMVQAILAQVGDALGYAHRQGVVHRDIKPGNILIDDEGWAVVTDFGIAKVVADESLTVTGVAVGTPAYMSPEQCSSDNVTGASDQYSLGIVAYEMLAGRPPFTGTSTMALMFSHFQEEPPDLLQFRPDCPPALHATVMRMLRKDPGDRWPSLEAAVASMGARPLPHEDPTRDQLIRIARTSTTHRIVAAVQTPRSPIPITRKRGSPTVEPVAPPPRFRPLLIGTAAVALLAAGYGAATLLGPSGADSRLASAPNVPDTTANATAPAPDAGPVADSAVPKATAPVASGGRATPPPVERATPPARPPVSSGSDAAGASGAESVGVSVTGAPARDSVAVPSIPTTVPQAATTSATSAAPPSSLSTPASTVPTVSPEAAVTATVLAYARALADADLAAARRIYPGMPDEQRQGLEALWQDGGSMAPRWTVTEVRVTGTTATARVTGTNVVTSRRAQPSEVPVALRARLERVGTEWRLVALVN